MLPTPHTEVPSTVGHTEVIHGVTHNGHTHSELSDHSWRRQLAHSAHIWQTQAHSGRHRVDLPCTLR
eukprot:NODE_6376_length_361_cov_40.679487_g5655_i0.p2 GENE.NODE_6376_length_361_cov_40.679487_g5655_i0~~NODE_6376_length_361_cov_40.679487_g5655_i0.p2  ORF type:complete len:67 (+),score=10.21 NODE_6376_length_361_cov_40.679487_g5655_i0:158-358(+)